MVPGCCLAMSVVFQLTILNCVINSPQIFYDIDQRHLLSCASVRASTLNAAKRTCNFITRSCMAAACNLHILNIQTRNNQKWKSKWNQKKMDSMFLLSWKTRHNVKLPRQIQKAAGNVEG